MAAIDLDPARALADLRGLRELTEDDRGATLVDLADEAAREVTGASARLFSGALHDAAAVASAGVPAAMLFVQSTGGISHAREEDTAPEHLDAAIRTFARLTDRVIERATPRA